MSGMMLAGKFRVIRQLGQGGMGAVYEVENIYLGQRVAMKLMLEEMVGNAAIVERFLREARASALLRGEHVCKVFDVGTLENGAPYIVMEMLQGNDLSSMLKQYQRFTPQMAADYVLQACLGIAEAHAAKIVHRDLKPANLFLAQRPDGTSIVKVLDFGIAKAPSEQVMSLTQTTAVMGSPGYMSPEQLRSSKNVDARSDIWSIGTILYELSVGTPPFNGESITELAVKVSMDPTPPAHGVPPELSRVIYRCLEKNPDQRYQSVAQLAHDLAPIAGPRGAEMAQGIARILGASGAPMSPQMSGSMPVSTSPTTLGGASGQTMPRSSSKKAPIVAGVIGVAVIVGGLVFALSMRGGKTDTAAASSTNAPTPVETTKPASEAQSPSEAKPVVEAKPAETKHVETNPGEIKPGETKPAETKPAEPVAETKPAEPKTAETKPAEPKHAETKPAETKTAETKPAETKSTPKTSKTKTSKTSTKKQTEKPGESYENSRY